MTAAEQDFEELVRTHGPSVLGFLARRIAVVDDAGDLLAETLLTAWRHFPDVPQGEQERRVWLLRQARGVLANYRRGGRRATALYERLRNDAATVATFTTTADATAEEVLAQLAQLPDGERDLLTLIAWDGLNVSEASEVLGIRAAAGRKRLQRARSRLSRLATAGDNDVLRTAGPA